MKPKLRFLYFVIGFPIMALGAVYHSIASMFIIGRLWADEKLSPIFDEETE